MARKLDKFLVVDVESTCWETKPPEGQINEIIEIGICQVDTDSLTIEKTESIIIKPQESKISDFCTKLTTLTTEDVDKGITFSQACNKLRSDYKSHERLWVSWGDYDRRQFERQCYNLLFNAKYPFGSTHLNIKNLFSLTHKLNKEIGMDQALKMLNLELVGTHHRGADDAMNIAKITCRTIKCHYT